jgi:cytochrome c oxidase assembly protein subunit 15
MPEPAMDLARRRQLLRRFAAACALLVLAVTSLSAFLRLDKTGLGCADWPACYGAGLRAAQAGAASGPVDDRPAIAAARGAHRVAAVAALALVVAMGVLCVGRAPRLRAEGLQCAGLLALTLALAVLGRYSADVRVPAVTIGNLLGGLAMLALCARLGAVAAPGPAEAGLARDRGLRTGAALLLGMVFVQAAVGALASASYAGLACSTLEECWRASRTIDAATLDPMREPRIAAAGGAAEPGALVQWLHRLGAAVVALGALALAVRAWRAARPGIAALLLALVAAELALGLVLVRGGLPLAPALLHNIVAALWVMLLAWLHGRSPGPGPAV